MAIRYVLVAAVTRNIINNYSTCRLCVYVTAETDINNFKITVISSRQNGNSLVMHLHL